ncbi:MAG: ATPase, T2SS/T4P/T4SS family [Candidatus Margulisiibacteriota bacterium]|jgi:type II secretory ATPase GspE/PulE/Tfp pilus assembly ATPase PilB-like protein
MIANKQLKIQIPVVDIANYTPEGSVLPLITESTAKRLKVLPLFMVRSTLVLAMADPSDFMALNEMKRETKLEIYPVLTEAKSLQSAIVKYYENVDTLQDELGAIVKEIRTLDTDFTIGQNIPGRIVIEETTPIIKLVNRMIKQAVKIKASDIHVEPEENVFRLRYRIDGQLQELARFPINILPSIVSRVKILSGLDITETRAPQDGRAIIGIDDKTIDMRISTYPTVFGENLVIRVLDKSVLELKLERLGITPKLMPHLLKVVQSAYGIVLVVGPTGSGKTTTMYAVLNTINSISKNIVTIEDPVEYSLELVRQTQVNAKIGLTFANGLRGILRQDPDIIFVGEIRDLETTEIAIQAALTGHLVFSTVHTNDAPSTIARLMDMGAEPFLLSSSINAILAQRLVRRICSQCKEAYDPELSLLQSIGLGKEQGKMKFYRGKGCIHCRNTGYTGRVGIFELMPMSSAIKDMVVQKITSEHIREQALNEGMIAMFDDGLQKARDGVTTIDEVLRATRLNAE